jgi:hypothetical protein
MLIDRFTRLDELKGKDRKDPVKILEVLRKTEKFSCFDVDVSMANTMTWLCTQSGWIKTKLTYHCPGDKWHGKDAYPWTFVEITESGHKVLIGEAK